MTQDDLKQSVATQALSFVLPRINSQSILGIGTGSTANFFIDVLAEHKHAFKGGVASSKASAKRLAQHGIKVFDLNDVESIEFYVDGADESNANLELIKGGGAALTQEKIVVAAAKTFICIADESKWVKKLGNFPLPVEVIPMARELIRRELEKLGGKPIHREGVITDNGGEILDVHGLSIDHPKELESTINQLPGVITNGLFALRPADVLLLGKESGVETIVR